MCHIYAEVNDTFAYINYKLRSENDAFFDDQKEVRPPLKSALAATYLNVSLSITSITGATTAR